MQVMTSPPCAGGASDAAAPPNDAVCKLNIDNNCHQPKKGNHCCKYCWDNGSIDQLEVLKTFTEGYCQYRGCFHWQKDGECGFCIDHDNLSCKGESILTATLDEAKLHKLVKREKQEKDSLGAARVARDKARSRSPPSCASAISGRRVSKLMGQVSDFSDPQLKVMIDTCVNEIFNRAHKVASAGSVMHAS